mgnify:CR=1 FL=1
MTVILLCIVLAPLCFIELIIIAILLLIINSISAK